MVAWTMVTTRAYSALRCNASWSSWYWIASICKHSMGGNIYAPVWRVSLNIATLWPSDSLYWLQIPTTTNRTTCCWLWCHAICCVRSYLCEIMKVKHGLQGLDEQKPPTRMYIVDGSLCVLLGDQSTLQLSAMWQTQSSVLHHCLGRNWTHSVNYHCCPVWREVRTDHTWSSHLFLFSCVSWRCKVLKVCIKIAATFS